MNTNRVTVVITCAIQPGKIDKARLALEANIKTVLREEPACHGIRVHDDPKNIGIAKLFLQVRTCKLHICRRSLKRQRNFLKGRRSSVFGVKL
ncbi:MAG TPA: hypothetical protein VF421_20675 [Niabella sp.]